MPPRIRCAQYVALVRALFRRKLSGRSTLASGVALPTVQFARAGVRSRQDSAGQNAYRLSGADDLCCCKQVDRSRPAGARSTHAAVAEPALQTDREDEPEMLCASFQRRVSSGNGRRGPGLAAGSLRSRHPKTSGAGALPKKSMTPVHQSISCGAAAKVKPMARLCEPWAPRQKFCTRGAAIRPHDWSAMTVI